MLRRWRKKSFFLFFSSSFCLRQNRTVLIFAFAERSPSTSSADFRFLRGIIGFVSILYGVSIPVFFQTQTLASRWWASETQMEIEFSILFSWGFSAHNIQACVGYFWVTFRATTNEQNKCGYLFNHFICFCVEKLVWWLTSRENLWRGKLALLFFFEKKKKRRFGLELLGKKKKKHHWRRGGRECLRSFLFFFRCFCPSLI